MLSNTILLSIQIRIATMSFKVHSINGEWKKCEKKKQMKNHEKSGNETRFSTFHDSHDTENAIEIVEGKPIR